MMTFYTNRFIPEGFAACTRGPFIFIRPQYNGDKGLLAHERTHVKQWAMGALVGCSVLAAGGVMVDQAFGFPAWALAPLGMALHGLLYKLLPEYRLDCELEAYQAQLRHDPQHLDLYAYFIAAKYGLKISRDEAIQLLK